MTAFPELKEVNGKIDERRKQLRSIFDEAGPDIDFSKVKSLGDSADVVGKVRELNDELDELAAKARELGEVKRAYERSLDDDTVEAEEPPARKGSATFGEAFVKSAAYGNKGAVAELDIEVKTLMTTTAGWAPETTRSGRVVDIATRPIQVTDIIPM